MRIAGQQVIRDRFSNRPLRPAEAIKVVTLNIIQEFFSKKSDDDTNKTVWSPDEDQTEMFIGDQYSINKTNVGLKPTVVVKRSIVTFQNKSGINQMEFADMTDGGRVYHDLIGGAINIQCYDKDGLAAEELAMDIFELFGYIKRVPRDNGFFAIDSLAIGEEVMVAKDSDTKIFMVPISFTGVIETRWKVTRIAQELAGNDYIIQGT